MSKIFTENLEIAKTLPVVKPVEIETHYYYPISLRLPYRTKCVIEEVALTTSKAIRQYALEGKVAAMNFASASNPGGGAGRHTGNGPIRTQEENLLAMTPDAYKCLLDNAHLYPLFKGHRALYLPDVTLTRYDDFSKADPVKYDMLVAPAVNTNNRHTQEELKKFSYREIIDYYMRPMLNNLLVQCMRNKCEVIILGAWGCGVFAPKNPTDKAAYLRLVREMMEDVCKNFQDFFKKIVFAIPF